MTTPPPDPEHASTSPSMPMAATAAPGNVARLETTLLATLRAIDRRRRLLIVLRGLLESVSIAGCGILALAAIDAQLHPNEALRETLGWLWWLVVSLVVLVRALLPSARAASLVVSARLAERAAGCHDEVIATAVQFAHAPPEHVSQWMVTRTMVIAAQRLSTLALGRVISSAATWRAAGLSLLVVTSMVLACLVHGGSSFMARAALPSSRIVRPSAVSLRVVPGDAQIAIGDTVEITAAASGASGDSPCQVTIEWDHAPAEAFEMAANGTTYSHHLEAVTRGFSYRVSCADAESPTYHVRLSTPPRVEHVHLRIVPPAYTHLPPHDVDGGDARVVAGSHVTISGDLSGDTISSATISSDQGDHAALLQAGPPQRLSCQLQATADLSWRWRLVASNGSIANSPQMWLLNVIADAPPLVSVNAPSVAAGVVSAQQAVNLTIEATDDLALHSLELQIRHRGQLIHRPLLLHGETAHVALNLPLDLSEWDLAKGDIITIQAVATDSGGQSSGSTALEWSVVSPEQADSARLASRLQQALAGLDQAAESCSAQARSWSALCRAAVGDDPQSRRGELVKIRDQSRACTERLGEIAKALAGDPVGSDASAALAQSLGAWSQAEGEQSEFYATRAQSDRDALPYGMAVSAAAMSDLDSYRHDARVLLSAAGGTVLQARLEAALSQWQRLPAEGSGSWEEAPWSAGLLARYYRGIDLAGEVQYQEVALPDIDNRVLPALGATNYSARFTGEVWLPFTGDWQLLATADDGVRLAIDGAQVLSPKAWMTQGATTYRAVVHAESGWHAIAVEYFQAGGLAALHLRSALPGEPFLPLNLERLRCHGPPPAASAIATIDPDPQQQSLAHDLHQRAILEQVLATPSSLHDLGEQAANSAVSEQGSSAQALVAAIDLTQAGSPPAAWLDQAGKLEGVLTLANGLLSGSVAEVASRHAAPVELADAREALDRLRSRVGHLQVPTTLVDSDSLLGAWQALGAGRSWGDQLGRELPRLRAQLLARAQQPGSDARACRQLSSASRHLGRLGRELALLLPGLEQSQDPHGDHQQLLAHLEQCEKYLREAERLVRLSGESQLSPGYAQLMALVEAWRVPSADPMHTVHGQRLRTQILQLLATVAPDPRLEALRASLLHGAEGIDASGWQDIRSVLQSHIQAPLTTNPELLSTIANGLAAAADRFAAISAKAVSNGGESAARDDAQLEAREAAVGILPESWLLMSHDGPLAAAWDDLGHDLGRFASDGHHAEEFTALAERASLLAQGTPAASATASTPVAPLLSALNHLVAELLGAGTDAMKRPSIHSELQRAVQQPGSIAIDPVDDQRIRAAAEQLREAITEEAAVRAQFMRSQWRAVAKAQELTRGMARGAAAMGGDLASVLASMQHPLESTSGLARGLVSRASRDPLAILGEAAADEGQRLQRAVAQPLHQAFLAAQDQRSSQLLSDLGIKAAALATEEMDAAAMLQHSRNHRLLMRLQLADAVGAVVPAMLPDGAQDQLDALASARQASRLGSAGIDAADSAWLAAAATGADPATSAPAIANARAQQADALAHAGTSTAELGRLLPKAPTASHALVVMAAAVVTAGAADLERASDRLAESAQGLSPADGGSARASALAASQLGQGCERALQAVVPLLDQAAPGIQGRPSDGQALAKVARTALALITAQPQRPEAYLQAAHVLEQAAGAAAMSASHPAGEDASADERPSAPTAPISASSAAESDDPAWGRLAQDPHQQVRSSDIDRFDAEDQLAIRSYLRRLGDQR